MSGRKPPPLLLGATLVFWGWQSGYTSVGVILALLIELPNFSKTRWDFSVEEFSRIWVFSTLLLLAGVVYAFTLNEGPSRFAEMFQDPDLRNQSRAGLTTARTAAVLIRWLPMIFFLFVAAQQYSARGGVPVETVSLILRRRWKKAKKDGKPLPPSRSIDISYIYLILCLFAASIHGEDSRGFFWGAAALLAWSLWPFRSPRFNFAIWAGCILLAFGMAWTGQKSLGQIQQYLENLNPQWLSSFQRGRFEATRAKTSLGQIGRIQTSQKIVIRVQGKDGPVPGYLREASFNTYKGTTWYSSAMTRDFERVDEESVSSASYTLVPGKTNIASVEISCFLPGSQGLLPLPAGTGRLTNLPAFLIEKSPFGSVHAQGPGLVIFDALFGPGEVMDSPPVPQGEMDESFDLSVPEREKWALDQVIDELDLKGKSKEAVMDKIETYFSEFRYSVWEERPRGRSTNMTPVARFLLQRRSGHCEYFATATVLLLHRLNIPARYAVGYVVHEAASGDRRFVVRQRDAHAWALVWDPDRRVWRDFDTTPGSWIQVESNPGWRQKISDAWSRVVYEFLRIRWGQTRLREYILWIVVPILLVLLAQIAFTRRKRAVQHQPKGGSPKVWPGLDSEFYDLERSLRRKGFVRDPGEPVSSWLLRGSKTIPGLSQDSVREVLRLHYRYRFDPDGLDVVDRELLRDHSRKLISNAEARPLK